MNVAAPLWAFASRATAEARRDHGATFADKDESKAKLHAFLAWQEEPGNPLGTAIDAGFFGMEVALAKDLVTWLLTLFELSPTAETGSNPG